MSRYTERMDRLFSALLGPGHLDTSIRRALLAPDGDLDAVPSFARVFVSKIWDQAHMIGDDEVKALGRDGLSEEQIFELVVSAACGAGRVRLEAGRRALLEVEEKS